MSWDTTPLQPAVTLVFDTAKKKLSLSNGQLTVAAFDRLEIFNPDGSGDAPVAVLAFSPAAAPAFGVKPPSLGIRSDSRIANFRCSLRCFLGTSDATSSALEYAFELVVISNAPFGAAAVSVRQVVVGSGMPVGEPMTVAEFLKKSYVASGSEGYPHALATELGLAPEGQPGQEPLRVRFESVAGAGAAEPNPLSLVILRGFRTSGMVRLGNVPVVTKTSPLFALQRRPPDWPAKDGTAISTEERERWTIEIPAALTAAEGVTFWNDFVDSHWRSLRSVKGGQAFSTVPKLLPPGDAKDAGWDLRVEAVDRDWSSHALAPDDFRLIAGEARPAEAPQVEFEEVGGVMLAACLQPAGPARPCKATFGHIRTHSGEALAFPVALVRRDRVGDPDDKSRSDLAFELRPRSNIGWGGGRPWVRMGALDLIFGSSKALDPREEEARASLFGLTFHDRGGRGAGLQRTLAAFATIDARVFLPVVDVLPGGQDPTPEDAFVPENAPAELALVPDERESAIERGFRREPSLLIRPGVAPQPLPDPTFLKDPFWLLADERTRADRNHTIRLQLRAPAKGGARDSPTLVVAVDRHPFQIAAIKAPSLRRIDFEGGILEVANWSNAGAAGAFWEVRDALDTLVWLPPQGVGEAHEKTNEQGFDIDEGKLTGKSDPIDFRLTPAAKLTLAPYFSNQRFTEPIWNLRRGLGWPGERAPGMRLREAQLELLYGMTARLKGSELVLAEQLATLGRYPSRLPAQLAWSRKAALRVGLEKSLVDDYLDRRKTWSAHHSRLQARLAILELLRWGRLATLRTEVEYVLRRGARTRWPMIDLGPDPVIDHSIPKDPDGLAGGVCWGFESRNLYRALWRDPESVEALLADVRLSALGGWGHSEATFDHGLTKIYADVSMGRVTKLTIERMGRLSVFWNLAKHVLVYERTVARNPQFEKEQDALARRPVVRKVREYVEVLQPQRAFPDGAGSPVGRGCVRACGVKSTIIDVKGSWGGDVGSIGWRVPLWNPNAGELYPRPHVVFDLASASADGSSTQAEILDPENVWFFTLTTPGASRDPNDWSAVTNVDFPDRPKPQPAAGTTLGNGDEQLPDGLAVEPGHSGFTWKLAPSARPADLVAERTDSRMGAVLANVTLSRGAPLASPSEDADKASTYLGAIDQVTESFEGTFREVASFVLGAGALTIEGAENLKKRVGALGSRFPASLESLKKARNDAGVEFRNQATGFEQAAARIRHEIKRTRDHLPSQIEELRDRFVRAIQDVAPAGASVAKKAFVDAVRVVGLDASKRTYRISSGLEPLREVVTQAELAIRRLTDTVVLELRGLGATLRRAALDGGAEAGKRLEALAAAIGATWSRLASALEALEAEVLAAARERLGEVAYTIRDAIRKLGNDSLPEIVRKWRRFVEQQVESVVDAIRRGLDPEAPLREFEEVLEAYAGLARDEILDRLSRSAQDPLRLIEAARAKLRELADAVLGLEEALAGVGTKWADELAKTLENVAEATSEEVRVFLDGARKAVTDAIDTKWAEMSGNVEAWLSNPKCELIDWIGTESASLELKLEKLVVTGADTGILNDIKNAIAGGVEIEEIRARCRQLMADARVTLAGYVDRASEALGEKGPLWQTGDRAVRLLRAFGQAPVVSSLGFNRDRVAYYFDEARREIGTTPMAALVDRAGSELKAMGLRVPTTGLLERVIPASLQDFSLSSLFPDFAGIRLTSLFPSLKMPAAGNDGIRVSQGVDPQTGRGWLEATVDVPVTDAATLFAIGPIAVRLPRSHFAAKARLEAAVSGGSSRAVSGAITADWELHVGSLHLVTFRDTVLRFDETGKVRFELAPEKVVLEGAMAFIGDVLKTTGSSDSGLSVRFLESGGIPIGIESVVNLPLPDLSFGAIGISHLQFGAALRVLIVPEFRIEAAINLARKAAPFAISIAFLSGGGWLEAATSYAPISRTTRTDVTVGIVAGAQIAFALGPIRGGIYFYFGVYAEFHVGGEGGQGLTIGIMVLLRGEAEVLGFISIALQVLLEARYSDGGRLVGRGSISISVKIFWCFTLRFAADVEYVLSEGDGKALPGLMSGTYAEEYYSLFEEPV